MTPDRVAVAVGALAALTFAAWLARPFSRLLVAAWLVTVFAVPVWIVLPGPGSLPVVAGWGCLVAVALTRVRPTDRVSVADWLVGALVVACLLGWVLDPGSLDAPTRVVTQWVAGYVIGRMAPARVGAEWLYRVLTVLAAAAAFGGILEFVTSTNPFHGLVVQNNEFLEWAAPQSRAGLWRVEGAFGHSIAYGLCLALTLPVVLRSSFSARVRAGVAGVIVLAIVLTFSRAALVCAVLGVALTLWRHPPELTRRARTAAVVAVAAVGCAVLPALVLTFVRAGREASESAFYRLEFIDLLPRMQPLGYAAGRLRSADGTITVGAYRSVDNALVLIGLTYGWCAMVLLVGLMALAVVAVVRRRATAPLTALVAHIPALLSVALITQYTMYVWFVGGLAVATWTASKGVSATRDPGGYDVDQPAAAAAVTGGQP